MKAEAGGPIVCECGHQAGTFIESIEDGRPINRIHFTLFSFSRNIETTRLRCKHCEAPIAETISTNRWRIQGRDGWIV